MTITASLDSDHHSDPGPTPWLLVPMSPDWLEITNYQRSPQLPLSYLLSGKCHVEPFLYLRFPHHNITEPPQPQHPAFLSPLELTPLTPTMTTSPTGSPFLDYDDDQFGLPRGFLASHPSVLLAEKADPQLLPSNPICPGPYLHLFPPRLDRPSATQHFRSRYPELVSLYEQVVRHKLPNYLGARIPVTDNFNQQVWDELLEGHSDRHVTQFMLFGWPTSFMGSTIPTLDLDNHTSSLVHPQAIHKFIT